MPNLIKAFTKFYSAKLVGSELCMPGMPNPLKGYNIHGGTIIHSDTGRKFVLSLLKLFFIFSGLVGACSLPLNSFSGPL